ncbi:toll/interleukin-1 receptor domain-containing protein [Paenarthrobacter sp. C1]|uniref:toll/interleukin-1 receptor domain-containing protein n=1 Tax=Paenarthrobacter sp. C1 TaxID=3400220 RepID=UPI003BF5231C
MKLAEAVRATKSANDTEKKRADLEKKIADIDSKIYATQNKYEKQQQDKQNKALAELGINNERAAAHFRVPAKLRSPVEDSQNLSPSFDVFLSHASEDKDEIARPLMEALQSRGLSVWFDELKIKLGQSIRQEIEKGIAGCRFGVVVISPEFFSKQWTQAELDSLFGRKMESGDNLILPIWHRVSKDEVMTHSPLLAGILALNTSLKTIEEMADDIADVVRASSARE